MCGTDEWFGPLDAETMTAVLAMLERESPVPLPQCAPAIGVHQECEHDRSGSS